MRPNPLRSVICLVPLFATALSGCSLGDSDEVMLNDNFGALGSSSKTPAFALGTKVRFEADYGFFSDKAVGNWRVESDDSSVIRIAEESRDEHQFNAMAEAVGIGTTTITVYDGSDVLARADVSVDEATEVIFLDRAIERALGEARLMNDQISLVNGSATALEVRYQNSTGGRVFGTDLLEFDSPDGMLLSTDTALIGRDREYLIIDMLDEGIHDVDLMLNDSSVHSISVRGVPADIIDSLDLISNEGDAEPGQHLCAALLAYDAGGNRILGPPAQWSVNGEIYEDSLVQPEDILCYTYEPDIEASTVVAKVGDEQLTIEIHGTDFSTSSARLTGCSAGGSSNGIAAALALMGLAFLRRRRRAHVN